VENERNCRKRKECGSWHLDDFEYDVHMKRVKPVETQEIVTKIVRDQSVKWTQ
jgi:hypothetical protein